MDILLQSTGGPRGWPDDACGCASCSALRTAGVRYGATRVLLDGVPVGEHSGRREVPGGLDVTTASGGRVLFATGPGSRPEPVAGTVYDAVLLDLAGAPEHLGWLRRTGAVAGSTGVHAVHVDHRISGPRELARRLAWWTRPPEGPHRTLLLGGRRSGKSAEAELRLAARPEVCYVATGPSGDGDPEWAARVAAHRGRRPSWWRTAETGDLAGVLREHTGALLIDGIGTWLASVIDRCGAWPDAAEGTGPAGGPGGAGGLQGLDAVELRMRELVAAWRSTRAVVVAVSDEVGLSLVPVNAAGRLFGDLLGALNQRLAAESEDAALVVAGRVVGLPP